MRRFTVLLVLLSVVALVVGSAVPVGAAAAKKTEYMTAGCLVDRGWADRWWETGTNGGIHFRGLPESVNMYLLVDDAWVQIGTMTQILNANVDSSFNGNFWGTFSFSDDGTIGDFDGRMSYPEHGIHTGTGKAADGRLMKVTHGVDAPIPLPDPWACSAVRILVIDPHG